MNVEAARIVAELGLAPLPFEGGFFRRQWTSEECDTSGRAAASLISFLITAEGFSAFHRVDADEKWEFRDGDSVEHVQLDPRTASPRVTTLAGGAAAGAQRSLVVPAGVWQAARLAAETTGTAGARGWALLGCTMTPAWDKRGFALGERAALLREFAGAERWIRALTR